jgi:tetratricopeptide (TPR) repeat protein
MSEDREFEYDVFISYSHDDQAWVVGELLPRLEGAGLDVCIDYRDFEPGAPSVTEMEQAVVTSRKTVLVLTPAYLESAWAEFEALMLQTLDPGARKRRLIPLRKEKCDLPLRIGYLTYVDFAEPPDMEIAWVQLLTALGAPPVQEAPPEPTRAGWCLAHPYPMPPNFTGRDAERQMLTEWLEGEAEHPLLVLRALGGFGKSALAWHWLMHDVEPARWPRVVWWSFYDEREFDTFLRRVLEYLGLDPRNLGPRQQADALLRALQRPSTLLILDGFERTLRAYGTLDAAYQGDKVQRLEQATQRDCVSPIAEHFLRGLCVFPGVHSKALMTTRLRPCVLEQHGDLLQGCREVELTQMQPADAVAFLRLQGVRGARAEIERVCRQYGFHPLALRLLAGLIVTDLQMPGDMRAAERLDVTGNLKARRHHVLQQAYENLTSARQNLLSRIACFRGSVAYDALRALAEEDEGTDLDADLRDLVARGLLHHDRRTGRYDLHPIVRRYAYDRLTGEQREAAHGQLRDYFAAVQPRDEVERLEDLTPVIEWYHHTVRASQYDEAFRLFRDRLATPMYFQFGAYDLNIELLSALFPGGEPFTNSGQAKLPRLKDEDDQGWTLNSLANSYSRSGQPSRAIALSKQDLAITEKQGDNQGLAVTLVNLADNQLKVGALRAAEANLRRSVALSRELEERYAEAVGHSELGHLLAYRGQWAEAEEELATALKLFEKEEHVQGQGVTWAYRALRALWLARETAIKTSEVLETSEVYMKTALVAARRALELADQTTRTRYAVERDYVRAHWLLGAAHWADGNLDEADRRLSEALTRCRRINLVEFEAYILLDLARLRAETGNREDALRLAQEVLLITERCGYVLQGTDVHLFLAEMALEDGDKQEALEHAQKARQLATCDGPPDCTYKVAYDEAGALLARLGQNG